MKKTRSRRVSVPSDTLLAECRRLVKRWRIQADDRKPLVWQAPFPGELISIWLRECAAELEHVVKASQE